jgi:D-ribose pyranase
MLITGVINGQLASLLARFRHLNSVAIVDGPFPSYADVELVDLAIVKGFPTIPQVLDAILPLLDVTEIILAREFSQKVEPSTVSRYLGHHLGKPTTLVSHEEFKLMTGQSLGIIHTGDPVPYSSVILKSG